MGEQKLLPALGLPMTGQPRLPVPIFLFGFEEA